ncbi:hypothetical protein [Pseudokineococcus sp. 1T1Z-3]|uniref:hypothetical protein n=1 Tax=Pseudokineococcus sp. 1T1Z-3 TaxID=3132745 RepID=UPI0030A4292D
MPAPRVARRAVSRAAPGGRPRGVPGPRAGRPGLVGAAAVVGLVAACSAPAPVVDVPDGPPAVTTSDADPTPQPEPASETGTGTGTATGEGTGTVSDVAGVVVHDPAVVAPDLPPHELEVEVPAPVEGESVAVVDAWAGFWKTFTAAAGVPAADPAALGQVATGEAFGSAQGYVDHLVETRLRIAGRLVVGAEEVTVSEGAAVVLGCSDARDYEVDGAGVPQEAAAGLAVLRTELVQEEGVWKVSRWREEGPC